MINVRYDIAENAWYCNLHAIRSLRGGAGGDPLKWVFQDEHIIGNGSFGVVYQATVQGSQPPKVCSKQTSSCVHMTSRVAHCSGGRNQEGAAGQTIQKS